MTDRVRTNVKGYELIEQIGTGGFGAVHRACQSTVGREVAIKIILPEYANQPDFIRRFETEAQVIAKLEHPHIVPLHDYWRDPTGAYLVMRFLRGGSLNRVLEQSNFTPENAMILLEQIAGALNLAHRNNIVHRDIKPGNILLDEDENAYLADFGIAKDLTRPHGSITKPDAIIGSLDYISPEQARNEQVTARTDIYSLGVVLYEMLTGSHPFADISSVERLYKHINDPLPLIDGLNDEIRQLINDIIQKATAKDPDQRYGNVIEFIESYRNAISSNGHVKPRAIELLTPREHEVLGLMVDGLSNSDIAQRLYITQGTVKWYITQIYRKLKVRGRVQAIIRARELDLIIPQAKLDKGATDGGQSTSAYILEPDNPYKGLEAFEAADSQDFFGRENLISELLSRLSENGPYSRFLAIIGPSGSGKSSLVKAGLIPALWCGGLTDSESWYVVTFLPGTRPIDELEVALTRFASSEIAGHIGEHLMRDENGLLRISQLILPDDGSDMVIIIDQFEELFTLTQSEEIRSHFINLLKAAITDTRSRIRVIITLRADFYDRPLHYPEFGEMIRNRMETILPLSSSELERAITKPAERVGVKYEEGLVTKIISEVNYQAGALPLLQYCLTELFERRNGHNLTHQVYNVMGGAIGALAKRAEGVFSSLDQPAKTLVRQMFLRLVTLGEGTEDTRRRITQEELLQITDQRELMEDLIDLFTGYRLLSLDHDAATRQPTVEVAHEAILREWSRLRNWLNESRNDIRLQRKLMQLADEWHSSGNDVSYLLQGARLDEFLQWRNVTTFALTPVESSYLETCINEQRKQTHQEALRLERETRLEQRNKRILQVLVIVFMLVALGSAGVTAFAINERNKTDSALTLARRESSINHSMVLAANAQDEYSAGNVDLALALAKQSTAIDTPPEVARQTLLEMALAPGTQMILDFHSGSVTAVQFSPDGVILLSASCPTGEDAACATAEIILANSATGEVIRQFEGHNGQVTHIVFHPTNRDRAVTASEDKTAIIWDLQSGKPVQTLSGHDSMIRDVKFIDENTLITASDDSSLILWDYDTGEIITTLDSHMDIVYSVDVSPDGLTAISASADSNIILWDVNRDSPLFGSEIRRYEEHIGPVGFVRFVPGEPENLRFLSSGDDLRFLLWDVASANVIKSHQIGAAGESLVISNDGHTVLHSLDDFGQLWDLDRWGQPEQPLNGHTALIHDTSISPDGKKAATASADGTIRIWNISGETEIARHNYGAPILAFATDGQNMLIGSAIGEQLQWADVVTGEPVQRLVADMGPSPGAIDLSADGKYAIMAHADHALPYDLQSTKVWDLTTGEVISSFTENIVHSRAVAISPDGKLAATGSQKYSDDDNGYYGDLILWDAVTGESIRTFDTIYDSANIHFNSDASLLVSGSAVSPTPIVQIWDVTTGELVQEFNDFPDGKVGILDAIFGPNEKTVLTGAISGAVTLWDIETGTRIRDYVGHNFAVWSLDMSPDGKYIVSGSADTTVIIWDFNTGDIIHHYRGHQGWVFDVAFHPDGQSVFSASGDGTVRQWKATNWSLDELTAWIENNRYLHEFTCEERETFRIEPYCLSAKP